MMQWVSLTLGPHRGGRRLWMQGLRLAVAGYVPGATYTVLADAVHRTLTLRVAEDGERVAGYDEAAVSAYMKNEELVLRVGLGLGDGRATVYTCDFTHGYIDINGSYRS